MSDEILITGGRIEAITSPNRPDIDTLTNMFGGLAKELKPPDVTPESVSKVTQTSEQIIAHVIKSAIAKPKARIADVAAAITYAGRLAFWKGENKDDPFLKQTYRHLNDHFQQLNMNKLFNAAHRLFTNVVNKVGYREACLSYFAKTEALKGTYVLNAVSPIRLLQATKKGDPEIIGFLPPLPEEMDFVLKNLDAALGKQP